MKKEILAFCESEKNKPPRASEDQFYQFVWVDKRVNEKENQLHCKSFQYLGYVGFITFESVKRYQEYLESEHSKMNIIVFTGGPITDEVIHLTFKSNLQQKKV